MQRKIPSSSRKSHAAALRSFVKISISARKRGDSKRFICRRSDRTIALVADLFFRPRLRHVLNAWFADVTDQHKRQSICVRSAELIQAGPFARFGGGRCPASLSNCNHIGGDHIFAPDLCLWGRSDDVKCAVGANCPDSAERVCPRASKRGRTGRRHRRAGANECGQRAGKNDSKRML